MNQPPTGGKASAVGASAFVLTTGFQRLVGFLLLPVYAIVLSPSQFGSIALLLAAAALVGPILTFGLEAPLLRACIHDPGGTQVSAIGRFLLVVPLVGSMVLAGIAALIAPLLDVEPGLLAIAVVAAGLTAVGSTLPLVSMRAQERFRAYMVFVLLMTIGSTVVRVLAILVLDLGVLGWVIADLTNGVLALMLGARLQFRETRTRPVVGDLRSALNIGVPLVPHFLAHWGLNVSDRIVLAIFVLPAAVGIYGVAYQIGSVAMLAVTEVFRATMPRFGEAARSALARESLAKIARSAMVVSCAICSVVALGGAQALFVLFPEDFSPGAAYIPWVALAAIFLALYFIPMNGMSLLSANTSRVWIASLTAAVLNIALNLAFVPVVGATAAAVNTAVGYCVMWLLVASVARSKGSTVDWEPTKASVPLGVIVVGTLIVVPLALQQTWWGLVAALGMSLVAVATATVYVRRDHGLVGKGEVHE